MGPKSKKEGRVSIKIPNIVEVLEIIESNSQDFVDGLKLFADIYSSPLLVSVNHEGSTNMAMKMAVDILRNIGAQVEELAGFSNEWNGREVPIVLAYLEVSMAAPILLIYCLMDGADTRPIPSYQLSTSKYVRGRGVHDAASFLIWINMILAHKEGKITLPYNIKFILDGSSRSNATQLIDALALRIEFVREADVCIASTCQGLSSNTPDIVYGFRGICDFFVNIIEEPDSQQTEDNSNDLLLDMLYIMNSLVDSDGNVIIDGLSQVVAEATEEQKIWFSTINFNKKRLSTHYAVKDNPSQNKADHLERLWSLPTVIFKGIEKSKDQDNPTMYGKFSILTVPNHNPIEVRKLVFSHIMNIWKEHPSRNKLEMGMDFWAWPWRADANDEFYRNLAESITLLYGRYPQGILSGSYLAFPAIMRKLTNKNVLMFSMGSFYDFQMTEDERLLIKDYINGIKLAARLLHFTTEKPQSTESKAKKKKK